MKRDRNTEITAQDSQGEKKSKVEPVKLSVSQEVSPISKQLSKECVEAINYFKKHYPARTFELMKKLTEGKLSENGIKVEYKILEKNLGILESLLNKYPPHSPAFLRVHEFYNHYFDTLQIIKSFLFCHQLSSAIDKIELDLVNTSFKRIKEWKAYFQYEHMGMLFFLEALTNPTTRKNIVDELNYHIHFLSIINKYLLKVNQQFVAQTHEEYLARNKLENAVRQPLTQLNANVIIINSLVEPVPQEICNHALTLINNRHMIRDLAKFDSIIETLKKYCSNSENSTSIQEADPKTSQYLELVTNTIEEMRPVLKALKELYDLVYHLNFSDETIYILKSISDMDTQLSLRFVSLNKIKSKLESLSREFNSDKPTLA